MQLITTHETTDFDGLASCVALQKLFPGARIGFSGGLASNVHRYLTLHRDRFNTEPCRDLPLSDVDVLIVTDVRRRSRLGHIETLLERAERVPGSVRVVVWDHHPSAPDDVTADEEHVQPVGAVTTLLIEELQARDIGVDPDEATLFALGIHEDTGSLVYSRTSSRDARALAWLLGQGAQPAVVQRFLRPPLGKIERALLMQTIDHARRLPIQVASVGIAALELDKARAGLARVTTEAFRILAFDVLFGVYRLPNGKTHIVGRGQTEAVKVGAVMSALGGGGHPGAGSATLRSVSLPEAVASLESALAQVSSRPTLVRDLMSSPVRTVAPEMSLAELAHSLHEWRHHGAPVVKEGRLVGIISQRDVERAQREGRLSLPVASVMAHQVHCVQASSPLANALEMMKAHDIGRLPVLHGARVVGILSREDVLRYFYGE